MTSIEPILGPDDLDRFRRALGCYTTSSVQELLGPVGQAAHSRTDLDGVARQLRGRGDDPLVTLFTLFLLGRTVSTGAARAALAPLSLVAAERAGLVELGAHGVRALLEVRPYSESSPTPLGGFGDTGFGDTGFAGIDGLGGGDGATAGPHADDESWWVVSDLGSDVRPGPLATEHVLGIGAASLSLAQATPRTAVASALDVGTGCGIQALHLARHSTRVTATDVSPRALRFAATTAALSGQDWDLRPGSLLEPVPGEQFELIVANPPFVVSDGASEYDYRDGGRPGDALCRDLVRAMPAHLTGGGVGHLLANWIVPDDGDWRDRVGGWLAGRGCDAWVWQREVAEPGEYVSMWLRDAGEQPGTPRWTARYDRWLDWFAAAGVPAIGMGLITMWLTDADDPCVVLEDVPQPVRQPVGAYLPAWRQRQRWLATQDAAALLDATLRLADGVVRSRDDLRGDSGWQTVATRLRQSYDMCWELDADDALASLVAACDGSVPLRVPVAVLAASMGLPADELADAALPALRDLIRRGFLLPTGAGAQR